VEGGCGDVVVVVGDNEFGEKEDVVVVEVEEVEDEVEEDLYKE
jgi:hypothetical protein